MGMHGLYWLQTVADRRKFRDEWESLACVTEIARRHQVSRTAVYHEARRGSTGGMLPNGRPAYDPERAQEDANRSKRLDGRHHEQRAGD